jgi:hypothetical protein
MQQYRQHSFSLQKLLFYPIKVALFERSTSLPMLVKELNKRSTGINYTIDSLHNCFYGKNTSSISLHYYSNIYSCLSLPIATPQYLYESFLRWEEIKQFKLDRRNANRIKKGLEPVNSISTRIK